MNRHTKAPSRVHLSLKGLFLAGTPMHNVTISGNTVVNCKTAAIGVQYCKHARVEDNTIQNPMAAGLQTAWGQVNFPPPPLQTALQQANSSPPLPSPPPPPLSPPPQPPFHPLLCRRPGGS